MNENINVELPDPSGMSVEEKVDALYAAVVKLVSLVSRVLETIAPALEKLERNPMFKMLTGGK